MTNCNPTLCNTCRNQFTCQKYRSYVEVAQKVNLNQEQPSQPIQSNGISPISIEKNSMVDSTVILQELSTFKDSMIETVATRYFAIENQIKPIVESITSFNEVVYGLSEKLAKLDRFINMVEKHNAQSGNLVNEIGNESTDGENELAIYTGNEIPLKPGDIIQEKKRGFFGLGKEKDVTRIVK